MLNNTEQHIKEALKTLSQRVNEFCLFYKNDKNYNNMIYAKWSAKDVLGHITFWHESFARNLKDLSDGVKPNPLKGKLSEVNHMSVESTRNVSILELIIRLKTAQKIIEKHITNTAVENIPYKKGSRDYNRLEHLQIVENHINRHLKDLKKP